MFRNKISEQKDISKATSVEGKEAFEAGQEVIDQEWEEMKKGGVVDQDVSAPVFDPSSEIASLDSKAFKDGVTIAYRAMKAARSEEVKSMVYKDALKPEEPNRKESWPHRSGAVPKVGDKESSPPPAIC